MRPPQYSPSRLQVYQTCPRQFYYQYVRKMPRRPWANQSFGVSLHRTLHRLHAEGGPEAKSLSEAERQLEASWMSAGYDSPEQERSELARGKELLSAYYETWSGVEGEPILLEKRLSAPFRGSVLLGILDRVDRHADGSLEILDYKSGRAPETVRRETVQQLSIYHYLVEQKLHETPVRHTVHYLASNVRVTLPLTADHVAAVLEAAHETIRTLEADHRFEPRVAAHCGSCDYQNACPVGRRWAEEASEQA
jgi:RecB family exonuclease